MIEVEWDGISMRFQTHPALFSPGGMDAGTRAMLSAVSLDAADKVLDLGCGYGVVGIYAAKRIGAQRVVMADVDSTAVALAVENAALNGVPDVTVVESDGFRSMTQTGFTLILSNPPYHTDFSVAKHFIEKGFNRLTVGGRMVLVTKRRDWYKNKLVSIFGGVHIEESGGYFVFTAQKRGPSFACAVKKPRAAKQG